MVKSKEVIRSEGRKRLIGVQVDPRWLRYQLDLRGWTMDRFARELGVPESNPTINFAMLGYRRQYRKTVDRWLACLRKHPPIPGMAELLAEHGIVPEGTPPEGWQ